MQFLKNLFGGSRQTEGADRGLYFYVQPRRCKEIVRVRIDPMNELSEADGGGYFVRKIVRGNNCPFPAELVLMFSDGRTLKSSAVEDGELVTQEQYEAWVASKES
jgi:hypothetical protein